MAKPIMQLFTHPEAVTEQVLQFYLTQMLSCVETMDGNTAYSFMKFLDVANLLDLATESVNWEELPFRVEIAYEHTKERRILSNEN